MTVVSKWIGFLRETIYFAMEHRYGLHGICSMPCGNSSRWVIGNTSIHPSERFTWLHRSFAGLGLASDDVGDVVQLYEILHLRYLVTPRMVVIPYLPLPCIMLRITKLPGRLKFHWNKATSSTRARGHLNMSSSNGGNSDEFGPFKSDSHVKFMYSMVIMTFDGLIRSLSPRTWLCCTLLRFLREVQVS